MEEKILGWAGGAGKRTRGNRVPSVFRVAPHRASGARGPSGIVSRFGRVPFLRPGRNFTWLGGVGRVKDRRLRQATLRTAGRVAASRWPGLDY